ncbi:MAG: PDDEXK nuclease domain-containing protein [bacterium]|nr:PDDEXK nuclease domain-containing protein [bacterium]
MSKEIAINTQYNELLAQLKQQIRSVQAKAAVAVNTSIINLYWNTGKMIAENQALFEGRNNYVAQLEKDLKAEFPDIKGFSRSNLFYMRKFYQVYSGGISVQQLVGLNENNTTEISVQQLVAPNLENSVQQVVGLTIGLFSVPWGHHVVIINKIKQLAEALFYIQQTIENNWSRAILTLQIEQNLFARQGKAITNFNQTLPEQQALMATQILKDPYNFGFLTLEPKMQELDIERQLTQHITKFLLELGKGFAFIGRQYPLQVGDKDYRLDLLFYHIRLRCFVVVDLKVVEFQPEFAGKMNFYLSVVDEQIKTADDQPTIGIILCKNKNKLEVEYALKGMSQPIGVSEFEVTQALPAELKSTLPTVEEFENELNKDIL